MTTTVDRLRELVHAEPTDWTARLVLAEALEDEGDMIGANGQRWQAQHKKCPYYRPLGCSAYADYEKWEWWAHQIGDEDCLPEPIWQALVDNVVPVRKTIASQGVKDYLSPDAAELSLVRALWSLQIRGEPV